MDVIWYCYIFIIGSVAGSFLHLCIRRIPKKMSLLRGKELHPCCGSPLTVREQLPILGYLLVFGRCPGCKKPLSPAKPLCELLYALLTVLCVRQFGFTPYALLLCLISAVLLVVAGIDLNTMEIPNIFPALIIGIAVVHFILAPETLVSGIIGFFAISVPMLLLSLFSDGFGGGDIKLCAACGLFLGYRLLLLGFLAACILAALIGGPLLLVRKENRKTPFAFGPFLSAGFLLSALWGADILSWYLSLF